MAKSQCGNRNNGAKIVTVAPDWLIPVEEITDVINPSYKNAWIDENNQLWVLSYDRQEFINVTSGSGEDKPTLIINKDGYITVENSGTYEVTVNLNEEQIKNLIKTPISSDHSITIIDTGDNYDFKSNVRQTYPQITSNGSIDIDGSGTQNVVIDVSYNDLFPRIQTDDGSIEITQDDEEIKLKAQFVNPIDVISENESIAKFDSRIEGGANLLDIGVNYDEVWSQVTTDNTITKTVTGSELNLKANIPAQQPQTVVQQGNGVLVNDDGNNKYTVSADYTEIWSRVKSTDGSISTSVDSGGDIDLSVVLEQKPLTSTDASINITEQADAINLATDINFIAGKVISDDGIVVPGIAGDGFLHFEINTDRLATKLLQDNNFVQGIIDIINDNVDITSSDNSIEVKKINE